MPTGLMAAVIAACSAPRTVVKPLADGAWRDTTIFDSRSCGTGRHVIVKNGEGYTFVLMAYPPWGWGTGRFVLGEVAPGRTDTLLELQPNFSVGATARDASFIARKAGDNGFLPPRHLQFSCTTAMRGVD